MPMSIIAVMVWGQASTKKLRNSVPQFL